ncbi:MAG: Fic family protein, partial [Candidatus Dormibacteraceae bacterium]
MEPRTYIWKLAGWPHFTWDEAAIASPLHEARKAQWKLQGMVEAIGAQAAQDAAVATMSSEVISNSLIEGINLSPEAVRASMMMRLGALQGGTPPTGARRTDRVVGVLTEAVRGWADPLSLQKIFDWQMALIPGGVTPTGLVAVGELRGDAPMRVVTLGRLGSGEETVHYEAPPRKGLENLVNDFLAWFNAPPPLDGLLRAGLAHLWFVTIHPFEDGNGRITRTITDLALAQDEQKPLRYFSLSAQIMQNKGHYYDALEAAQQGSLDVTEWLIWFLDQVKAATATGADEILNVLARRQLWEKV